MAFSRFPHALPRLDCSPVGVANTREVAADMAAWVPVAAAAEGEAVD